MVVCFGLVLSSRKVVSSSSSTTAEAVLIVVDQSGKGDYRKIQEAINSVASNNSQRMYISIKPGTYRKIVTPAEKPFITLSGTEGSNTTITWNDSGEIFESPTLSVMASDFVARYLTIQVSFHIKIPILCYMIYLKIASFSCCYQMFSLSVGYIVLLTMTTNHVFISRCKTVWQNCQLNSLAKNLGIITAQHRNSPSENTGFIFLGCKITGLDNSTVLGRPWGPFSRVIFANTYMSNAVSPEGWRDWDETKYERYQHYGEYKCYGPGANRSNRVKWSHELSRDESAPFMNKTIIGGRSWLRPTPTRFKKHMPNAN
uniref:putative pectinesterase 11 n=1 Tax=Erigeron canadensis TaxID=72917 RepID=UPI001CB9CBDA|nr:putative pectinesterase 11 [Erigeron canadensis]